MGRDIPKSDFSQEDFTEFRRRLREESRLLMDWFKNDNFETSPQVCGFELEAWLLDQDFNPFPINEEFLQKTNNALVVPELSKFNFEINSTPFQVEGSLLSCLAGELADVWKMCEQRAGELGANIMAIGILPTMKDELLTLGHMSDLKRFHALNRQVFRLRKGKPITVKIDGKDTLEVVHKDVMLEAVATSLQIHLQVNPQDAVRYYNLAQIVSAPMVAVAANSPFLFGKDLWDETRIPIFEQAISAASFRDHEGGMVGRVTFGTGYGRNSMLEPFLENLDGYPVLLPLVFDDDPTWLSHLRLHNGTIWRWNRPLIGLSEKGIPHLRIEHRVTAAGPTIPDMVSNIAFFLGLALHFTQNEIPLESQIDFEDAKRNFYLAAQFGLRAKIKWLGADEVQLGSLVIDSLLPAARSGLLSAGLDAKDVAYYLDDVMRPRVLSGQNGAAWQRSFVAEKGMNFQEMTQAYYENQKRNIPVHEWTV